MSPYAVAIDWTTQALERRARYHRNHVVVVVFVGATSVASAFATRTPAALAGLLFLIPVAAFFFLADARVLNAWRSHVVASWASGDIQLAALRHALGAHPALPKDTTGAMLATLPSPDDLLTEQRIPTPTRRAAAAVSRSIHDERAHSLLLTAIASGVAATAIASALWTGTTTPLLGLATLVLRPVVGARMHRRRRLAREAEVDACRSHPEFKEADYRRLVAGL